MKSMLNSFRAATVALSSISLMAPSAVLAKSPAGGHVTSQARISASTSSTPTTIRSSNGLSSDKISNLSVNSTISGSSQPGGYGHRGSSIASSTVGNGASTVSAANSNAGAVVHDTNVRVPVYSSLNVKKYSAAPSDGQTGAAVSDGLIDLNQFFSDFFEPLGHRVEDPTDPNGTEGPDNKKNHLTNGQDSQDGDGGKMGTYNRNPDGSAGKPVSGTPISMSATVFSPAPGSGSSASIANSNAKYYDRNAYIKTTNKNIVSKEIEKKYDDSHPVAQKNKVTGGGNSSTNQNSGSNGGGGTSGGGNTAGSTTSGSTSKKPNKCCPMPIPFPFPLPTGGCDDDGGYTGGDVSPAIYNADEPAPAPVTTASATAPLADTGIDLVLEDVKLAAPATLVAGPAYTVTFRNQGTADAGKFQVAIAAGFNQQLKGNDPRAMIEILSLAAGEVKEVTLRLPHRAMLVEDDGRGLVSFRYLTVAIDATNVVAETDKTNNTAVVERAAIEGGTAAN